MTKATWKKLRSEEDVLAALRENARKLVAGEVTAHAANETSRVLEALLREMREAGE